MAQATAVHGRKVRESLITTKYCQLSESSESGGVLSITFRVAHF